MHLANTPIILKLSLRILVNSKYLFLKFCVEFFCTVMVPIRGHVSCDIVIVLDKTSGLSLDFSSLVTPSPVVQWVSCRRSAL